MTQVEYLFNLRSTAPCYRSVVDNIPLLASASAPLRCLFSQPRHCKEVKTRARTCKAQTPWVWPHTKIPILRNRDKLLYPNPDSWVFLTRAEGWRLLDERRGVGPANVSFSSITSAITTLTKRVGKGVRSDVTAATQPVTTVFAPGENVWDMASV